MAAGRSSRTERRAFAAVVAGNLDGIIDSRKENGSFDVGLNVRDGDSPGAVGVILPGGTSIRQTLTGESDTGNLLALDRLYGEDEILAGSNGALEGSAVPRGEPLPPLSQVTLTV